MNYPSRLHFTDGTKLDPQSIRSLFIDIWDIDRIINNLQEIQRFNVKQIQKVCSHDWEYIYDPSGNNDSYYICMYCKKESRVLGALDD